MVFKRLQDSQDSLYLQAMQLYQSSFPLHEQRKPDAQRAILKEPDYQFNLLMEEDHLMGGASLLGNAGIYLCRASVHSATAARTALRQSGAGAAWAKRKAGHSGNRPTHRRHLPAQERLL